MKDLREDYNVQPQEKKKFNYQYYINLFISKLNIIKFVLLIAIVVNLSIFPFEIANTISNWIEVFTQPFINNITMTNNQLFILFGMILTPYLIGWLRNTKNKK